MADLSITSVSFGTDSTPDQAVMRVQFGETVSAGDAVYQNGTTNKYELAVSNSSGSKVATHVAILGDAADEYGLVASVGEYDLAGVSETVGTIIYSSAAVDGALADAQPASGNRIVQIGQMIEAGRIRLDIQDFGVNTP